jgi:hypothetical protein
MLNADGVGGSNSFEKYQSETVKIPDTQTRRFCLIKDATRLISKPNNCGGHILFVHSINRHISLTVAKK